MPPLFTTQRHQNSPTHTMSLPLYIPETITVGFQQRPGTFTGKLAYIIYTDRTGKLRKEGSWNSWRDKSINSITVDNIPTPNFTLNKGVQRSSEWFGSGRSMVRVWDPRDFEFEITVDNLLNVLMHADVSKRDITEQCVYAWQGTNLVLLPINSVEYQRAVLHSEKQSNKVSTKELVVGHTYSIKKDDTTKVVYLGRLDRYEQKDVDDPNGADSGYRWSRYQLGYTHVKKPKKYHVFIDLESKEVVARDPSGYVATCISDEQHPMLAELLDTYYHTTASQPVSGVRIGATSGSWVQLDDGTYVKLNISNNDYHKDRDITITATHFARYDDKANTFLMSHDGYSGQYGYGHRVPKQNPTNRTSADQDVVDLINHVRDVYNILPDEIKFKHSIEGAIAAKMTKYHMGRVHWCLADGKTSTEQITY